MNLEGRRVLVTNVGAPSAIAVARALGRRGAHVIATDHDPRNAGFRSRAVAERVVVPEAERQPEEAAEAVLREARARAAELIVPTIDQILIPLSRRGGGEVAVAMPSRPAFDTARDKAATVELARRLSVPVPPTTVVSTVAEAVAAAPALGWPLVLKPQRSHAPAGHEPMATFGVTFARDEAELVEQMATAEGRTSVLLQAYVGGTGIGVELLLHEGRPLAAFQHRRLREVPVTGGMSALRASTDLDPQLYRHALALLGDLGWTGLAMVEFRVDAEGAHLMEINGRVWGSMALAVRSGMDFPSKLVALHLDGPPARTGPPDTTYRRGVRVRNLELELRWAAAVARKKDQHDATSMPPRWHALRAIGGLLWPGNEFDVQVAHDPVPGIVDARNAVRSLVAHGLGRATGDRRS